MVNKFGTDLTAHLLFRIQTHERDYQHESANFANDVAPATMNEVATNYPRGLGQHPESDSAKLISNHNPYATMGQLGDESK